MDKETFERAKEIEYAKREINNFITALETSGNNTIRWDNSLLGKSFDVKPFMAKDFISSLVALREKYQKEFDEL